MGSGQDDVLLGAIHGLGMLYTDQGKLGEAEKIYQRALEGYETRSGECCNLYQRSTQCTTWACYFLAKTTSTEPQLCIQGLWRDIKKCLDQIIKIAEIYRRNLVLYALRKARGRYLQVHKIVGRLHYLQMCRICSSSNAHSTC